MSGFAMRGLAGAGHMKAQASGLDTRGGVAV